MNVISKSKKHVKEIRPARSIETQIMDPTYYPSKVPMTLAGSKRRALMREFKKLDKLMQNKL